MNPEFQWKQISAVAEGENHHQCVYALSQNDEIWGYIPKQDEWFKVRTPNAAEQAEASK